MDTILQTRDLHASYGAVEAIHGINISVANGGITALLGANGAGKTTTLRSICQTVSTRGEIEFEGERIDGLSTEAIVRAGIAHVPDGRGTFLGLSVEENLRLGAYTRIDTQNIARDFDRMYDYFPRLKERRTQQAGTLSGGEQQMLAIARALMSHPRLLLLDEPSFGLAPIIVQELFRIMQEINVDRGVSMLLVEQNAKLALDVADTAFLMETGEIVTSGDAAIVKEDETVRRAYLGY
ncbi:MAG: ABC transporter ATP-binding protein [Roseitalea sp.]|jgi:branched-chain amino acid transport system ATP-binding protein|nr:ABC transporter ATP-binding protein [Roseitalea sp.]MBO6722060.1 ABC transporter ATP-binding protein [Roseitalea sp.]MBO6741680.1 ABC transporter ATP-binding protein [Roseitalea sp.]